MAALRRLLPPLASGSKAGTFTARRQEASSKATKALKVIAAAACATAAAGAAYYGCSFVGKRSGLGSHVEARLVHLALPSVSATEKVQWDICQAVPTLGPHTVRPKHPHSFKMPPGFSHVNTTATTGASIGLTSYSARETTITLMCRHHKELSATFGAEMAKWSKALHRSRDLIAAIAAVSACIW